MKKTHRATPSPAIMLKDLADYMAASNQARRSIVASAKYTPVARLLHYKMARSIISGHVLSGNPLPGGLSDQAQAVRERLADTDFDAQLHALNGDYIDAFASQAAGFDFSGFSVAPPRQEVTPTYNGTRIRFSPDLLTHRTTQKNTQKVGAIMYRYAKGKAVSEEAACWQTAFMFGYFTDEPFIEEAKPERKLCLVLCAVSGKTYEAPSNSTYRFNEMKAVCRDIAERWPSVEPPSGAVL